MAFLTVEIGKGDNAFVEACKGEALPLLNDKGRPVMDGPRPKTETLQSSGLSPEEWALKMLDRFVFNTILRAKDNVEHAKVAKAREQANAAAESHGASVINMQRIASK